MVNGHGIFTLGPADAEASGAPSTLALARQLRMELEEALHEERNRSALAGTVLSISLVVFLGLLLFLFLPKIGELKLAGEEWVRENSQRIPHIKVRKVELLSVGALQNFLVLAVSAVGRVTQIICIYAYITVCLSLFETTAPWVEELNGLVLSPFTTLLDRLQRVFPTATLTAAILLLLVPAWRVTGQLARSVERGDVHLELAARRPGQAYGAAAAHGPGDRGGVGPRSAGVRRRDLVGRPHRERCACGP